MVKVLTLGNLSATILLMYECTHTPQASNAPRSSHYVYTLREPLSYLSLRHLVVCMTDESTYTIATSVVSKLPSIQDCVYLSVSHGQCAGYLKIVLM